MHRVALAGWILAGVAGLLYFWFAYPRVFPEASIDVRITPQEALERGARALRQLQPQLSLDGWRSTVEFAWDEQAKRYLEKTLGLEQANATMRNELTVWAFRCMWQREGERTRYWASITPAGEVVAAGYTLPEETLGARLSTAQARAVAEKFLQTQLRIDLRQWRLVDTRQYERPQRLDYYFVYEHRTRKYPANADTPAKPRLSVFISGDQVSSYSLNWLYTPERWAFEQRQRESQRRTLSAVLGVLYAGLQIVAVGLAIWLVVRRQPLAWRFALRITLVILGVMVLAQLNLYPLWWTDYDPAQPELTFLTRKVLGILSGVVLLGVLWFAFATGAEWLSRAQPLGAMPFAKITTLRFWTTDAAVRALWVGLALAGVHLAYVCVAYLLGFRLGAWVPLQVPYTNGVVLPLPFVEPLLAGLLPAVQEELMFRGIALYLLWRVLKRFWAAALLSSAFWAFLHIGYPTEPIYMRGLELIPVGLTYCWVAARYGILASITAHYTYNALLTATAYVNMDAPYLRWSALMVAFGALAFFLPAAFTYLRHRQLPTLESVPVPAMDIPPAPQRAEPQIAPYRPLTRLDWALLAGVLAVITALDFIPTAPKVPALAPALQVNRTDAERIATDYLTKLGVNLEGYRAIATFVETEEEDIERYARDIGAYDTYRQIEPMEATDRGYWYVRFFRVGERTEWYVYVGIDGEVWDRVRVLPEEAAGTLPEEHRMRKVMLTEAQARQRAERYLTTEEDYDLSEWKLVETDYVEHPNRTDYTFTYEHRTDKVGEARKRLSVSVQGLLVHDVSEWWDVPEQWFFQQRRVQAWGVFAALWVVLLVLGLVAYAIFWEFREGNATSFSVALGWRTAVASAVAIGLMMFAEGEPSLWRDYDPATPPAQHLINELVARGLLLVVLVGFIVLVYAGLEPNYWRTRLGHLVPLSVWLSPSRWREAPPNSPLHHPAARREGVLVALIASVGMGVVAYLFPNTVWDVDSAYPWLRALAFALLATLIVGGFGLVAVGIYRRYLRSVWGVLLLVLAFAPAMAIGVSSWVELREQLQDYALAWATVLITGYAFGKRLLQGNLLAWALMLFWTLLAEESAAYLVVPNPALRMQGWILLAIYLLTVAVALVWAFRQPKPEPVAVVSPEAEPAVLSGYAVVQMESPHAGTERREP
ncbi:MAG: CPBP family intramembrane glutamic endopeptidase [Armatimonadota bacterium]|nr:CPBP family intramembrane glutamic endopeptidase [Armatimonadota bacterium]